MLRRGREFGNDQIDHTETHIWGKLTYSDNGGSYIMAKGTGTQEEQVTVMQGVAGFNLDDDSDAEIDISMGNADSMKKRAFLNIPHKSQRKWAAGTGGVQSPTDGSRALDINKKRIYADDTKFATRGGIFEVDGDRIIIRGRVVIEGDIEVAGVFKSPSIPETPNPTGSGTAITVPGFVE